MHTLLHSCEKLALPYGVKVELLDTRSTQQDGCAGRGMPEIVRSVLIEPAPLLILGFDSRSSQINGCFGSFLQLPWVQYVELPTWSDELEEYIVRVVDSTIDPDKMDSVKLEYVDTVLLDIENNVSHRLNGVLLAALNRLRARFIELANSEASSAGRIDGALKSLTLSLPKLQDSVSYLQEKILMTGGIAQPPVQNRLVEHQAEFSRTVDSLRLFLDLVSATGQKNERRSKASALAISTDELHEAFKRIRSNFHEIRDEVKATA